MAGTSILRILSLLATLGVAALAPSVRAAELRYEGSLRIELGAFEPLSFAGTGVARVNDSAGGVQLSTLRLAGGIGGTATIPLTDPEVTATLPLIRVTPALGTGTLSPFWPIAPWPDPQLQRAALPIRGSVRLCLFDPNCASAVILPLSGSNGAAGVGVGGQLTAGGFGTVRMSISGNPWTVFTASWPAATQSGGSVVLQRTGFLHGPSSFSSAVAESGGALQLVTPLEIRSNTGFALPGFATLTVRFVPEPDSFLLAASGVAGLLFLGRNTRRTPRNETRRT